MTSNFMNLQSLKSHLQAVMPILDGNLAAAYREYMDGTLAAGAYRHVLSRHEIALAVISDDTIHPETAYKGCALLAIDLRSGVEVMADKDEAKRLVNEWWQCYRGAGFTEINQYFEAPQQPQGTPSTLPSPEEARVALRGDLPIGAFITHLTPQPGNEMEPGVPEVEVFDSPYSGSKRLPCDVTVDHLKRLIRAGIAKLESTSGRDPGLHYRYDHYLIAL